MTNKAVIAGIAFEIGQRWRECDRRFVRIVTIVGFDPEREKVQICYANRYTWASAKRFNGKSHGYELLSPIQTKPAEVAADGEGMKIDSRAAYEKWVRDNPGHHMQSDVFIAGIDYACSVVEAAQSQPSAVDDRRRHLDETNAMIDEYDRKDATE